MYSYPSGLSTGTNQSCLLPSRASIVASSRFTAWARNAMKVAITIAPIGSRLWSRLVYSTDGTDTAGKVVGAAVVPAAAAAAADVAVPTDEAEAMH